MPLFFTCISLVRGYRLLGVAFCPPCFFLSFHYLESFLSLAAARPMHLQQTARAFNYEKKIFSVLAIVSESGREEASRLHIRPINMSSLRFQSDTFLLFLSSCAVLTNEPLFTTRRR